MSAIPAFFSGLPLEAEAFRFSDAQKWLDAHIDDYAGIYIHEIRMTEFFIRYSNEQKKKFLVDFNDAISMNYRDGWRKMRFPENLFFWWEGNRVAWYESKVLTSFSHFNIVSEVDKQYLLDAPTYHGEKTLDFSVILHGAPISQEVARLDANKLFFIGSLDYRPNRDALLYFLNMAWAHLRQEIPELELLVVGGGSVSEKYRTLPGVHFLGYVPSVFEAAKHAKALIAPIRFGGGTPSKIVEAMGYGFPVITTPQGAGGISGAVVEENIVVVSGSDTASWVTSIKKILSDDVFRNQIAKNARMLIAEKYSADAAQKEFQKRFHDIVGL